MTLGWPWPILGQGQILSHSLCIGKNGKIMGYTETTATCELKSLYMQSTKWVSEVRWVSKVKVIPWPWPKVTQIPKLKLVFLRNFQAIWNQISFESFWEHGSVILFNSFLVTCWRWLPYPYMNKVKTPLKNLLLWHQLVNNLVTWYVAYVTRAYHSLFEWWSCADWLFYP